MDVANFIIGQLVGLAEPLLVLGFIIKCLQPLEGVYKTSKENLYRSEFICFSGSAG